MLYKNWPYWLKGATILGMIYAVLFFVSFSLDYVFQPSGFLPLWFLLFPGLLIPSIGNCLLGGFSANLPPNCDVNYVSGILVILNFIFYFIVGEIFGWIRGRRKT